MGGKKFSPKEYGAALLICAGVAGFAFGGSKGGGKDLHSGQVMIGVGLLLISVAADAFVPNIQQRFLQGPGGVTVEELMMRTNVIGCVAVGVSMAISGDLGLATESCFAHPRLFAFLLSVGSALGVAVRCYTGLIENFGSVAAVAVATLRKVVTVILSYLAFPKPVEMTHVVSGSAVLVGILIATSTKK